MAHRPSQRRPLANVLAELAYLKPDLVLVRGQHTFRIEHVSALARRKTKSGSESLRKYLSAFDFWWEEDPDGKIVIMTQTPEGPRPLAAEYGSKSIAWTLENEGDWGTEMVLSGSLGSEQSRNWVYEVHAFLPGRGFKAEFYTASSKEEALESFKQEYPNGHAFWVGLTRRNAVSGPPAVKYRVWWRDHGGDWDPHLVFMFDANDNLLGSIPQYPEVMTQQFWLHALSRVGNPKHRIEEVSEADASLLANEIIGAQAIARDRVIKEWSEGKFDDAGVEDLPDMDWPEV